MRTDKKASQKSDKKSPLRAPKRGVIGYSKKSALLEEAITHMNTGKYGRSSAALKELLALDPQNTEARRLFATLHLRLGSLVTARQAFESLANEAIGRQDYWLAESLLREYLAAGPRCVPFLEQLAHVYQEKGDELAAVNELGKAIEILRDDPDTDNPQKAAQLYSKIRELAPASPIAFQLASLFDVQTGEFLVRPVTAVPSPAVSDSSQWQADGTSSGPMETATPEVRSEERSDDPALIVPQVSPEHNDGVFASPDLSLLSIPSSLQQSEQSSPSELAVKEGEPPVSISEPMEQVPETFSVAGSQSDNASNHATSLLTHNPTVDQEVQGSIDSGIPSEAVEESVKGVSTPMPWDQVSDASLTIQEAENPSPLESSPSSESISSTFNSEGPHYVGSSSSEPNTPETLDPIPASQFRNSSASETTPLSAPMPWEQVADAAVAIPESELPPSVEETSPDSVPSSLQDTVERPLAPHSEDSGQTFQSETVSESTSVPHDVAEVDPPVGPAASQSSPPIESVMDNPPASSFSWHSVFDKALKFAVGPVAASVPVPSAETREILPEFRLTEPNVEPGSGDPEAVSSETFLTQPEGGATDTVTVITEPMALSSSESNPAPSVEESLLPAESAPSPIVTELEVNGMPAEESPAADLLELQTAQLPDDNPLTTMPASFSTVVDAQDIPEVESAQLLSEDSSSTVEQAGPEQMSVVNEGEPIISSAVPLIPDPAVQPAHADPSVSDTPSPEPIQEGADSSAHWNTGEVAVQVHRPSAKKKRGEKDPEVVEQDPAPPAPDIESLSDKLSEALREWESKPGETAPPSFVEEVVAPPEDTKPEWMQASEAITFAGSGVSSAQLKPASPTAMRYGEAEPASSVAESAVDVLFSQDRTNSPFRAQEPTSWAKPRPRFVARLHRVRISVASFIGSCFSTTRSLAVLILVVTTATVAVTGLGVGALGVVWMAMEEPPSGLYQNLTINPPRVVTDPKKNGYFVLLGFDMPNGRDPLQAGYERKATDRDVTAAQVCISGDDPKDGTSSAGAAAHVVKGWFRNGDPLAQLKGQGETLRSMVVGESSTLAQYQKWVTMSFDDWGYGQVMSPDCERVLLAHRLFLLDGFSLNPATGLDRLEADLQSWRTVLAQSKTLMMKMLAVTAVQDDAAVVSGLLSRSDLDGASLSKLSRMVRPLDQVELSLRWPMQSHFVWATKSVSAELKQDKSQDRPWYVSVVAAMRLPVQRRANTYADYYEASNKAIAEGRYANLPKLPGALRTPATGPMDYVMNPIENIVGVEPLPGWDPYVMRMMETDAQLRLVGLQAWIRRGPQEGDLLARLAKAGQAYYDPFTGLPMLVNQRKGLLYSVGRDGKDQEGDRAHDVVVAIPSVQSVPAENKRSTNSTPSRGL